ncbi:hypothetical protein I3843_12G078600 [Carya illinoinensis]|uniref:BHLH domain-containing protein n=1 Tax=Carya illinoinensis TaxID=32201 RepID=A0A922IVV8_CARIL|nr:hypothetical protein I3842_12G077500 [Carya illinoinensis]KAG7952830.1 hypothetical protein I3843_12G078600 [Carya illinoinensis]
MGEADAGSVLKKTLKSLCCRDGWSYGVFWRFVQRDSLLLTFDDAYYEEQVGAVVETFPLVHMLGEGVIGQAAFTGRHRWMFSDAHGGEWGSFRRQDIFQDDSEFHNQFSSGIKTIAVISVAPLGVVQFGSTQKILERSEFLDQTKRLFQEMENIHSLISLEKNALSLNDETNILNGTFASLFSSGNSRDGDLNAIHYDCRRELLGEACSATILNEPSDSMFGTHDEMMAPTLRDLSDSNDQLQTGCTNTQVLLSDKLSLQFQRESLQSTRSVRKRSSDDSILSSFIPLLASESTFQDSSNLFTSKASTLDSCQNTASNVQGDDLSPHFCPTFLTKGELVEKAANMHKFAEDFRPDDFTTEVSEFCLVDDLSQWFTPSPEYSINRLESAFCNELSQPIGVTSASSCLVGDDIFPIKHPEISMQSSIINACKSNGLENSPIMHAVENDLFNDLGLEFDPNQSGECWEDLIMPIMSAATGMGMSECVSELDIGSMTSPRKGLFSELGLQELLDGINNSKSVAKSSFEEKLSTTKRRRVDSSSVNSNQSQLESLACSSGSMNMMQPEYNAEKKNVPKKEVLPKSQVGLWIDDSYSVNVGIAGLARSLKPEEPTKAARKRARPGESTRPRPKDRQQIQDRIKELRGIIPHGGKCSIDSLLDRAIKYMFFLQSVAKYADRLKHSDEPKLIGQETGVVLKENAMDVVSGGTTWAFEVGSKTVVCPIIVEDLNPPGQGQMLIEMLCEEQGLFLEIADAIRGLRLNILKGVMEARDDKIWTRFIVEASSHVTRIDVFLSLVQLLNQTTTTRNDTTDRCSNAIDGVGISPLENYQQQALLCPITLAETLGC